MDLEHEDREHADRRQATYGWLQRTVWVYVARADDRRAVLARTSRQMSYRARLQHGIGVVEQDEFFAGNGNSLVTAWAKPRFVGFSISRIERCCRESAATISAVPSVEALSMTMISPSPEPSSAAAALQHAVMVRREFHVTMMMDTGGGKAPHTSNNNLVYRTMTARLQSLPQSERNCSRLMLTSP